MYTILLILLPILGGITDAIKDTVNFHYLQSIFIKFPSRFWDGEISWMNKYKDQDYHKGPKFFGSTTIFVWTTDAWHLFKTLNKLIWYGGIFLFITAPETNLNTKLILGMYFIITEKVCFNVFYWIFKDRFRLVNIICKIKALWTKIKKGLKFKKKGLTQ